MMPVGIPKSGKRERDTTLFKTCCCGKQFKTSAGRIASGRGKFCSSDCKYKNMVRRLGYKRVDKGINPSWFKPGHVSVATFPEGYRPANFKEEGFCYSTLHHWVKRHKGKAIKCERCGGSKNVQWANKSWEYKRDVDDWIELCCRCHSRYDRAGDWGAGLAKFPER